MKKIISMLLIFVMLLALSATALADEAPAEGENAAPRTLSFITAWRAVLANKLNGEFVKVGPLEMDVWVPDVLTAQTEMPDDTFLLYADSTGSVTMEVRHIGLDGASTLEELEEILVDRGAESNGTFWLNGFNVLIYEDKSDDSLNAVIRIGDDNTGVEFAFTGVSNEEMHSLASIIISTIQPHSLDIEDVALMIDADLNNTWGESRNVTYSKDGTSINVNMWDENMDADNIQNVKNWDAYRQDKIDYYNLYVEVLARFGMDDIKLSLNVTDPKEETAFLTLAGGEIAYDIFD